VKFLIFLLHGLNHFSWLKDWILLHRLKYIALYFITKTHNLINMFKEMYILFSKTTSYVMRIR